MTKGASYGEFVLPKRDLAFYTNIKTASFRIQNVLYLAGVNYPQLVRNARTGSLSLGCTAIILSVELTSTWLSSALPVVLGAGVGILQEDIISVAGASNLWISHFRDSTSAGSGLVFNSTKEFEYPFCPRVDASNLIVGYATGFLNNASDAYEGVATVTYFPIDFAG